MMGTTIETSADPISVKDGEENADEWEFDKELQDEIEVYISFLN